MDRGSEDYDFVPLSSVQSPSNGPCRLEWCWWPLTKRGEVLFYKKYGVQFPQCNESKDVALNLVDKSIASAVILLPVAFVPRKALGLGNVH